MGGNSFDAMHNHSEYNHSTHDPYHMLSDLSTSLCATLSGIRHFVCTETLGLGLNCTETSLIFSTPTTSGCGCG